MDGKTIYPRTARRDCICNLCQREVEKLSYDHIPPKGWMMPRGVVIENYPEGSADDKFLSSKSPNGLKFKTICSDCNNMLGARYDKALKNFIKSVTTISESPYNVHRNFAVCTEPALVVKSVLGHMLAANTGECNSTIHKEMRNYVCNHESRLSSKIKLYYWYYPYDTAVISLDKVACNLQTGNHAYYSVLKYYPVAFMMMYNSAMVDRSFCEMTKYITIDETAKARVCFKLNDVPPTFPESVKYSQLCLVPDGHTNLIARYTNTE